MHHFPPESANTPPNSPQTITTHNHTNKLQLAFPTDQRMRAKKKDEMLKAMGKDPKLLKQRKNILQEAHYDDCGSDFGGLTA